MTQLKENFMCVQVFDNGMRKIIGFYKTFSEASKMLDFNEFKIEVLKVSTGKRNFVTNETYAYQKSQKDNRSKRPF